MSGDKTRRTISVRVRPIQPQAARATAPIAEVGRPEQETEAGISPPPTPGGYRVGYRCPPLHGRIKLGEKRNPGGRPKGSKNTATLAREELERKVALKGTSRRLSVRQLAMRQQAKKAAEGDRNALMTLVTLEGSGPLPATSGVNDASTSTALLAPRDLAILDHMRAEMKAVLLAELSGTEHGLTQPLMPASQNDQPTKPLPNAYLHRGAGDRRSE